MAFILYNLTTANHVHVGPRSLKGFAVQTVIAPGKAEVIEDSTIDHYRTYGAVDISTVQPGYRGLAFEE